MKKMIWLDMDGTFVDLYGVDGWLDMLEAEDVTPYEVAEPLCPMSLFARLLNALKRAGYLIGVVSWTSKDGSKTYDSKVAKAKRAWIVHHLPSVKFDYIDIIPYGTPKHEGRNGILFDDNSMICAEWEAVGGKAYGASKIIEELKRILGEEKNGAQK